jgi:hypothetical protein
VRAIDKLAIEIVRLRGRIMANGRIEVQTDPVVDPKARVHCQHLLEATHETGSGDQQDHCQPLLALVARGCQMGLINCF